MSSSGRRCGRRRFGHDRSRRVLRLASPPRHAGCRPRIGPRPARSLRLGRGSDRRFDGRAGDGRSDSAARALERAPDCFEARRDAGWHWLNAGGDEPRDVVVIGDPRYPTLLLESADPPLCSTCAAASSCCRRRRSPIVGSRNPTPQGLDNARAFALHLSRAGWVVVSGLALGIDGAAHDGALEGGAGTIAVIGTGLDQTYPSRHHALTERIAAGGLVVSEFAIGTPALPEHFPIRNRIIAGLGRGTLVVEAAVQSGSLITARLASESGRDVFAIPGSIHSPQARGCHALIKQGAKLVDSAADIVEELPALGSATAPKAAGANAAPTGSVAAAHDPILDALGFDPIGLDVLIARTGRSASELSAKLLDLELQGRVARLAGQRFQRVERA